MSVVDEDTCRSGSSTGGRIGFKELVAEVGLGHVGLVLALEVSRFARSSADWHQLPDLCALTGPLIADADGVYSPAGFNDPLLGLNGTMAEAEHPPMPLSWMARRMCVSSALSLRSTTEARACLPASQSFAGNAVGGDLDARGQTIAQLEVQLDGHGRAAPERFERGFHHGPRRHCPSERDRPLGRARYWSSGAARAARAGSTSGRPTVLGQTALARWTSRRHRGRSRLIACWSTPGMSSRSRGTSATKSPSKRYRTPPEPQPRPQTGRDFPVWLDRTAPQASSAPARDVRRSCPSPHEPAP